jgi:hypothetical protein
MTTETGKGGRSTAVVCAVIALLLLGCGYVVGRSQAAVPLAIAADATPDATATRQAELAELDDLRTKVASTPICPTFEPTATPTLTPTPEPTETPTPTPTIVPAVAPGTELAYGSIWKITVSAIDYVPSQENFQPSGTLVKVDVTLTNGSDQSQPPPFLNWKLVDDAGNVYRLDMEATQAVVGPRWGLSVDRNASETRTLVFDVAVDATSFVLESDDDPTFRVQLMLESRG